MRTKPIPDIPAGGKTTREDGSKSVKIKQMRVDSGSGAMLVLSIQVAIIS